MHAHLAAAVGQRYRWVAARAVPGSVCAATAAAVGTGATATPPAASCCRSLREGLAAQPAVSARRLWLGQHAAAGSSHAVRETMLQTGRRTGPCGGRVAASGCWARGSPRELRLCVVQSQRQRLERLVARQPRLPLLLQRGALGGERALAVAQAPLRLFAMGEAHVFVARRRGKTKGMRLHKPTERAGV